MPIINIKEETSSIEVKCAACQKVTSHRLSALQLGASALAVDCIALPTCACGSQETLVRTFDGEDDGAAGHRKAVNALAGFLKSAGRVHVDAAEALRSEKVTPRLSRPLYGPV